MQQHEVMHPAELQCRAGCIVLIFAQRALIHLLCLLLQDKIILIIQMLNGPQATQEIEESNAFNYYII